MGVSHTHRGRPRQRPEGVLRIIGGQWRSRRVAFDPASGIRPTPDRARQTLFDWLAPTIVGLRCLDLYAGSGALGLEALSRGADSLTFVERDAATAAMLRDAVEQLDAATAARVVHGDALAVLESLDTPFQLVFIDPPYGDEQAVQASLEALPAVLAPFNRVYLEWPRERPQVLPPGYELLRHKRAGRVSYGLVTYHAPESDTP